MELIPTIGLEIHAELKTQSKMFCGSKNDPDEERVNANTCPVCLAHPGTLPVINRDAVRHVLRVGMAIGGTLADYTEFDRKNYFYPDLPKGYQLSQYEFPLVSGGSLNGVKVTRIHLEEDTARSQHDPKTGSTLIDFNRAGVPLMELVTEPVVHSAEDAGAFARELQLLLRYLGAGEANMEKGEMRVEANISVAPKGLLGTKVEVKNLNSFRSVERAIEYEIKRQKEILAKGGAIAQETRGWDEARQETFAQRKKEGSADYRYFPDPDLPKILRSEIEDFADKTLIASLPELPWDRVGRFIESGFSDEDARMLVREMALGDFLDTVVKLSGQVNKEFVKLAGNYLMSDIVKIMRDNEGRGIKSKEVSVPVDPSAFAEVIQMIQSGDLSSRAAKNLLGRVAAGESNSVRSIAEKEGLLQEGRKEVLEPLVQGIIDKNEGVTKDYKKGKEKALTFLIGECIKASRGSANPQVIVEILKEKLH